MSGHQQNQTPRGWNRSQPSPISFRPPSPWAPSPPPIISGPRRSLNSPAPMSPLASGAVSPNFGASGLRGSRGPSLPCPRPLWPGPEQRSASPQPMPSYQQSAPNYPMRNVMSPTPMVSSYQQNHGPRPTYGSGPKPYRSVNSVQVPSPSPNMMRSQSPFRAQTPPQILYQEPPPSYEFIGVPLEPPQPKSYVIYDDEEDNGPSTAEIIAAQSQDYVDEKLAEYQATILQLQEEQERVQKKTFVNWINSYLSKRIPPLRIDDIMYDLRDGTKLIALLEVLSGEKLPVEKGRVLRRPHFLSNANTALQFLASKKIKLVNINPADLVDGRPPVVLGLIWTIILYFQIEENSRCLEYLGHGIGGSISSLDSYRAASPSVTTDAKAEKWKQGARKTLLNWVTNALPKESGVDVRDFGASWRDGIAFLALIDAIKANLINLAEMKKASNKQRLETAFNVAETKLGIARLLDPEDVDVPKPDEKSIMTYVAQFLHKYPEPQNIKRQATNVTSAVPTVEQEYSELIQWLRNRTTMYENQMRTNSLSRNYNDYAAAKSEFDARLPIYMKLKNMMNNRTSSFINENTWQEIDKLWNKLHIQLLQWLWLLDSSLPGEFNIVGKWLAEAEKLIYMDDIPTVMNEETASIISKKLEEHKQFFADYPNIVALFNSAKNSPLSRQVPLNQIQQMEHRLNEIGQKAAQRRIRLKFLEHKCCLIAFLNLVENKLKGWTGKYGDEQKVQQVLEQYKNFVSKNKIFQEFDKAFVDMHQVVEEYKRDGDIETKDYRNIDQFLRETEDRWRSLSMELKCCQSMLEEILGNWKRWNNIINDFEPWLAKAQQVVNEDEEKRLDFFKDLTIWNSKFQTIQDTGNFLMSTSDDVTASRIQSKLYELTDRWNNLFPKVRDYMHAGDIMRSRLEYKKLTERLSKWLRNAESILERDPDLDQLEAYGHVLQKLATEVDEMEEIFKNISRLSQTLIPDMSRNEVDEMMKYLKQEKEAILRVKAQIPQKMHLYHQCLSQRDSLESGKKEINQWLDEAEILLSSLSLSGGKDSIQNNLQRHRNFFSRTLYYKSVLDSKNKVFQNMVKSSNDPLATGDPISQMKTLNDRFDYVSRNAQQWEQRLQEALRCWTNYKDAEHTVSDWLNQAGMLLSDRRIESKQNLETQKMFFNNINPRWMDDLVQAAQELIKNLPKAEQQPLIDHIEQLQNRWKDVLAMAPLHVMRLEFRLDESAFNHYIKDIEKEIYQEQQALNRNEDVDTIMRRNREYFGSTGGLRNVEKCLESMNRISRTYTQHNPQDKALEQSLKEAEQTWESVTTKVEEIRKTLQQIPAQWDIYHERFNEMVSWMDMVDESLKNIMREVHSVDEFDRERSIFQNICHEADSKREDMKWLVKTLDALLPYASEHEAADEQRKLEHLIARYKNLIPTIEVTMVKTEVHSKCYTYRREVHEVVCLLNKVRDQTIKAPQPDSLEQVNKMIQEQQFAISQLDHQRTHIMSMLQRGRDLSKDVHAPAFMTAEVKTLEDGWNAAYTESVDKLKALRGTQSVWSDFNDHKHDIISILGNAETELRSITPLQTDPKNVSSDLKSKRELNATLQQASRGMIDRLRDICGELTPLATPEKRPMLEKEVIEIEKQFFNVMEHVKDRVSYLEDYSSRWNSYKARLAELQAWANQSAPQLIEDIQAVDLSPEERVAKVTALQCVLNDKKRQLDILASDAFELAPKEGNISEAKRLKGEVHKLQELLTSINRSVDSRGQAVKEDMVNWQKYQAGIQEIKPWIEESEIKVNYITAKPTTIQELIHLKGQAQQFENQCEDQLKKLHNIASISHQMTCRTNAPEELDAVQSRWTSVHENAKQITNKYDKLTANWESFDNDANKLNAWLDDREDLLNQQRAVSNIPQIDKLEKELVKLRSYNNEISEQQAKLISLAQNSDQIALNLTPEGATIVKEKVNTIKAKILQLSDSVRAQINDVSDAIMARQDFNAKITGFSNWMDQLRGQLVQVEDISTDRVEPCLQIIHTLLQEYSDKKPIFNNIYEEVKELTLNATPEDSLALNDSYSALVTNYKDIEDSLLQRKNVLEKWSELLNWRDETENNINHLKHHLSKPDKLDSRRLSTVIDESEAIAKNIPYWKQQAKQIDDYPVLLLRETIGKKPISAIQIVNQLENKLDDIKVKSQHQQEVLNKLEERQIKFNEMENKFVNNVKESRIKLDNLLRVKPDYSNIDQIISDLVALNDAMQKQGELKNMIKDEGSLLMREDINKMPEIQKSILILEKEWDILNQDINDRIQKYNALSQALREYMESKDKFDKEINKAEDLYNNLSSKPADESQILQNADQVKKTADQLKRSKVCLDDLDRKVNVVVKQFEAINAKPNDIENELNDSHQRWQQLQDGISKISHLYETEAVIWRQIEDAKSELIPWLTDTNQSICDAANNTLDIEYGPIRLNKYKSELPFYQNIKHDINDKIYELTKINKGVQIPALNILRDTLTTQFAELADNAQKLDEITSSFEDQDRELRKAIKTVGDDVNKLRENIIKCDDMSGDNTKIVERLHQCKTAKAALLDKGDEIDSLKMRIDELCNIYPTLADSAIPKELANVQKRYESILMHSGKIEESLKQFLKKFYTDKVAMLKRSIETQKEKIKWCTPEPTSDKYNIEVKKTSLNDVQRAILDCENRSGELSSYIGTLEEIDTPENIAALRAEIAQLQNDIENLKASHKNISSALGENADLWESYDSATEDVTQWLKNMEVTLKNQAASQIDIPNLGDKLKTLKELDKEIKTKEPVIEKLEEVAQSLVDKNPEARVSQFVSHLNTRYQTLVKNIASLIQKAATVGANDKEYKKNLKATKSWLDNARKQFLELSRMGSPGSGLSSSQMDEVKGYVKDFENGVEVLNKTVDSGEAMFPGITKENREVIRGELNDVREAFDNLSDEATSLLSQVESALIQRNNFEESYVQITNWLNDSKQMSGTAMELYPTLSEKKNALQKFKTQLQDVNLHRSSLQQLQNKVSALGDVEAEKKVDDSVIEYNNLSSDYQKKISVCENHIVNHEAYDQILEKSHDWLNAMKGEAIDVLYEGPFEKDGAEEKLIIVDNLIMQKAEGDKIMATCKKQLEIILPQTNPSGHAALINAFEDQNRSWNEFMSKCENAREKLDKLCSKWDEFDNNVESFDSWLKPIEYVVRDQSLKSTLEAKNTHLCKLKELQTQFDIKAPELAKIVEEGQEIQGENELSDKLSRLNTRFQTAKNLCREGVVKYEAFSKDHDRFNKDYKEFKDNLNTVLAEVKVYSEIVGDYDILMERQQKIHELVDKHLKDNVKFEDLVEQGEKLYAHTSPDGREIIRQQIRSLRNIWDSFTDELNTATQKLDHCLLQFGEFTSAQEQLTKWLKDVEKAMKAHTELKSSLQEKKAQLQNHKLIHQDIMLHNGLVESVCEKAQQLVTETKDSSLNTYLQSIPQLFQNIVSKSQDLLNTLDNSVASHQNFNTQLAVVKSWLSGEMEKLLECDDTSGERNDINRRIVQLKQLKAIEDKGSKLMTDLMNQYEIVKHSTSDKGIELLNKEISEIQENYDKHFAEIDVIGEKLSNILNQWQDLNKVMEELSAWFKTTEETFRDQQLQTTLPEKEVTLNKYKDKREQVLAKQNSLDNFVDNANILQNNTGTDRSKNLISQLTNRYQLLQVLSKEVVNRWQALVEDHKKYDNKLKEMNAWLTPIEQKIESAEKSELNDLNNVLPLLIKEREYAEANLLELSNLGEKTLTDTSTQGREKIRNELREIRDRWDKIDEKIRNLQKWQENQSVQWASYQDNLHHTLNWLDSVEKFLDQENPNTWNTLQDVRGKLMKYKTTIQDINSHKRVIESIHEKANLLIQNEVTGKPEDIKSTLDSIDQRYEHVKEKCNNLLKNLGEASEVYQQFNDLQKAQQNYQKNLWDRLTGYSDYSGNKPALIARLKKVIEIQDALQDGTMKLSNMNEHIESNAGKIPARSKEVMTRDLSDLALDFQKFVNSLGEVKRGIENRLQQWNEYETDLDRLINWLNDAENSLKNYGLRSTIEEKEEQLNKFKTLQNGIKQNESNFDKLMDSTTELIQNSGDTRLSVTVQQITSRVQSIQAATKEIVKNCEQAVKDHSVFNDKYKNCANGIAAIRSKCDDCSNLSNITSQDDLLARQKLLEDLLSQQNAISLLLNGAIESGEKLYPSTTVEGREVIRNQLNELQQTYDQLNDDINNVNSLLGQKLSKLSGFEEGVEKLSAWLNKIQSQLPSQIELKTTLDEKISKLNDYREINADVQIHRPDMVNLQEIFENMPESSEKVSQQFNEIKSKYDKLQKRADAYVKQYEGIVTDHNLYSKAVMDSQEFIGLTHNTVDLWGALALDRVSLTTNMERLKNLQSNMDDEKHRIDEVRTLGEKVIPGTLESGQVNIQSQIDTTQQEWEGLLNAIQSAIDGIGSKLRHMGEFDKLREDVEAWIRNMDNKLHAIDLKSTVNEKKAQLDALKDMQGEIVSKELEIDTVSEKAQTLLTSPSASRNTQITDLLMKYQQISNKVKDLKNRWTLYVTNHQDFDNQVSEMDQWINYIKQKLDYCSDLKAPSQSELESKLTTIHELMLQKEEGFAKIQRLVESAQAVLANTSTTGHAAINEAINKLQNEWSSVVIQMADIRALLDTSINQWSGFMEEIQGVEKTCDWIEDTLKDLSEFQTTKPEKQAQLERIKTADEKVRLAKIDVEALKAKANEMIASGQQSQTAYQAQQTFSRFDTLASAMSKLLSDRETQYRDHRLYMEAFDDLTNWLNRAKEKLPAIHQQSLSDKISIENSLTPLDNLLNKQPQGELLVEHLQHTGGVVIASSSPQGQEMIRSDIQSLKDSFDEFFRNIKQQKDQLSNTVLQWRDFKDEFERLSEWLKQIDILIKNHKINLQPNLKEKINQAVAMKEVFNKLTAGQKDIDKFNKTTEPLLASHLDSYISNQLRQLNSRYQVQVNLATDVLKKVETNRDQHQEFENTLKKSQDWIENAKDLIRKCTESSTSCSKEDLQKRLEGIQNLISRRDDGQSLVQQTINLGEKIVRNTRSDGKEAINNSMKELQNDWDRLFKKMSTAKVHLETNLLQWADYSSSYTQLQQWISDREARLQEVCEQKVAKSKKGQPSLSSGLNERKANLRHTTNIVQDIVSFEPMIQSVASKASDLQQAAPATEISEKYENLSKQAKNLYEKQKETVEQHQALIDAENEFSLWLRDAKDRLSKYSEPSGDKETLAGKLTQLKMLQNEIPTGQTKLQKILEQGVIACKLADADDGTLIQEALSFVQDEFSNYVDTLNKAKSRLEMSIVNWTEYGELYADALNWLSNTEALVQSYNKLQETLEDKKLVLEEFQGHLQTLFDWQQELDRLNMCAQTLIEICSDTHISNAVTQLTTKYNALLSLAKEVMRRLESQYQEHQQHHSLFEECTYWIDNTREKLINCQEIPKTLGEVQIKMNTIKSIHQGFEQGKNKLRYLDELKERVIMNTEPNGATKIQENTENLKEDFAKLLEEIMTIKQQLANRAAELEEISKLYKLLLEWLDEISPSVNISDEKMNELGEKRVALEKFRALQRDINHQNESVNKIKLRIAEDINIDEQDYAPGLMRFDELQVRVNALVDKLDNEVNIHERYKMAFSEINDWIRMAKIDITNTGDVHGEKADIMSKLNKLKEIDLSMPEGKILMENAISLSEGVIQWSGSEGRDVVSQEVKHLNVEWKNLQDLSKTVHTNLEACSACWNKFSGLIESLDKWIDKYSNIVESELAGENKTSEDLEKAKIMLDEVLTKQSTLDELNDCCEMLMDMTACNRVRDDTVQVQTKYGKLLSKIQGLVAKLEKNLYNYTEFLNYIGEVEKWIERTSQELSAHAGAGDIDTINQKLNDVTGLAMRIPEGSQLIQMATESYTKAIEVTPADIQTTMKSKLDDTKQSFNDQSANIKKRQEELEKIKSDWEDLNDYVKRFTKWLDGTEAIVSKSNPTNGEFSEMKTNLERLKHVQHNIITKQGDLDHIVDTSKELASISKVNLADTVNPLHTRYNKLKMMCDNQVESLENEIVDYNDYHQAVQDTEKWLLQISFQLMAHNSLYISNREQTLEQIAQHEMLLDQIQKYQSNLDSLNSKGNIQIERYEPSLPSIRGTIETQLKNIQDSYDSLLNTSLQIKKRLHDSLAKFQEYEDTLDSIMENLGKYEPIINSDLDEPATTLDCAQEQLIVAQDLFGKLQNEKTRLAAAVQACESATASISRPSSPLDTTMQPIPEKELIVRAKLEDLTDQVQSCLSGLSATVNELKQMLKQRAEFEEWIKKQQVIVTDWAGRTSKLRPEAAKQELAAMNDLLNAIEEKRSTLMTEMTGTLSDDDLSDIEQKLDQLESDLMDTIAKKSADQTVIDDYRQSYQNMQNWFDSLIGKMDVLDKENNMDCIQKLAAIQDIQSEFRGIGPSKLVELKQKGNDVIEIVSNLDGQQVEEQLKSIERRYNDIEKRIERKEQVLEINNKAAEDIKHDIGDTHEWITEKIAELQSAIPIGYESNAVENRQQELKTMARDTEAKHAFIESLEKRLGGIQNELGPAEKSQLHSALENLITDEKQLKDLIKAEINKVSQAAQERKDFEQDLDKAKSWLRAKISDIRKIPSYSPLQSSAIENDIKENKKHEIEIKEFNDSCLTEVLRKGNLILKDCSGDDKTRLENILKQLESDYANLKEEIHNRMKTLMEIMKDRKDFEGDFEKFSNWLNEMEVSTEEELLTTSLPILEEQLTRYKNLKDQSENMQEIQNRISEEAKRISSSVSSADKLILNDQVKNLKDKNGKIVTLINERIDRITDLISKYNQAKAKLQEIIKVKENLQHEIQNLNKPIGIKVDDIKKVLKVCDRIIKDVKLNKEKLASLSGFDYLPELESVGSQHDDLIKSVEDYQSLLKQKLLVREQYGTLISDIGEFISNYSDVVDDLEQSGSPIEEKIKECDNAVVKIQENEALLVQATDKGQQIASEGNVADQNLISEELQALKQQLQNLRKRVEAQKQANETTLAEHKKLANDLQEVLDRLHENEGLAKTRPALGRDPDSAEREIVQHNILADDIKKYLNNFEQIEDQARDKIGIPGALQEMLSEGRSLLSSLPQELSDRKKYLDDSRSQRMDYITLVSKFKAWIHEAENHIQNGKHGIDFAKLNENLEEFKKFFNSEPSIKDLVTREIQDTVNKIYPSLNSSEQEDISRELQNHNQLLKNTLNSAKSHRAQLEQNADLWKNYQQMIDKIRGILAKVDMKDEPISNLSGLSSNIHSMEHILNELKSQQPELDNLNQKATELLREADPKSRQKIEKENLEINAAWNKFINDLEGRRDKLNSVANQWDTFEKKLNSFENQIIRLEERSRHVELIVRSRRQLEDTKNVIQELFRETDDLKPTYQEIVSLSKPIFAYLGEVHKPSLEALKGKFDQIVEQYKSLQELLKAKDNKLNQDLEEITKVFHQISEIQDKFNNLLEQIKGLHVFDENQTKVEGELEKLKKSVNQDITGGKKFVQDTRDKYISQQDLVPSDVSQEITLFELLSEQLQSAMEEKDREHKRAKTVRTEYLNGVDEVQAWIQNAEGKIKDRTIEPTALKEILAKIQQEVNGIQEKLELVKSHGKIIMEKTRSEKEKELVQNTLDQLNEQLSQVRSWLDEKRGQVGDTLDAWARFMNLYQIVMAWAAEKRTFVAEPLKLESLHQAKQKMNDYSNAVKSIKPIVKNISEMNKELDEITQLTLVGDLSNKLKEADDAKTQVEATLLERHSLLQETCEEWEQCERKLKDVQGYIEKTRNTLDTLSQKKKPLRDQHILCEKIIADITAQKTKIIMSIEKLQVHFRSGIGGDENISKQAAEVINVLDNLYGLTQNKKAALEKTLDQIDVYQHQMQDLRQKIVKEEQQLRKVLAPNYLPHDREKATTEQHACRERIKVLQSKIVARNERIKLLVQRGTPDDDQLAT